MAFGALARATSNPTEADAYIAEGEAVFNQGSISQNYFWYRLGAMGLGLHRNGPEMTLKWLSITPKRYRRLLEMPHRLGQRFIYSAAYRYQKLHLGMLMTPQKQSFRICLKRRKPKSNPCR